MSRFIVAAALMAIFAGPASAGLFRVGDLGEMPSRQACMTTAAEVLESNDRIAFRYVDAHGEPTAAANPNGSADNIAGVLSPNRRVLGMMPHPERLADRQLGGADGAILFDSLCAALAEA